MPAGHLPDRISFRGYSNQRFQCRGTGILPKTIQPVWTTANGRKPGCPQEGIQKLQGHSETRVRCSRSDSGCSAVRFAGNSHPRCQTDSEVSRRSNISGWIGQCGLPQQVPFLPYFQAAYWFESDEVRKSPQGQNGCKTLTEVQQYNYRYCI